MTAIITLEHVEQWYDQGKENAVHALKDVNLSIEQGDYVSFFGPSGCGKTTLLYAISGIDKVASGKIIVKGRDIAQFGNQELAMFRQTGIGIVFQQFNLVPSLTVLQNIALPLAFVGIGRAKAEEEAQKLVKRLDLEKYASRYPTELSGGQQQRVGIARALANNPPILIADEPLGNLDSINAKNALDILRELNEKDGRTIIMVTHEAWSLQDVRTIYHMKDGAVLSVEHRDPLPPGSRGGGKGLEDLATQAAKEAKSGEHIDMVSRIIANFFMRGHTFEETERFERVLQDRLARKVDAQKLQELLGTSFAEGGVGLWHKKAERIASYVEGLMTKQQDLTTAIELINANPELSIQDEVRELRQWMLAEYQGEVSPYKAEILDELVSDRIHHFISDTQFLERLHTPVKEFGAGFPVHSAQRMAERLEIVVKGAGEYVPRQ